jgi:hypothetical protein
VGSRLLLRWLLLVLLPLLLLLLLLLRRLQVKRANHSAEGLLWRCRGAQQKWWYCDNKSSRATQ